MPSWVNTKNVSYGQYFDSELWNNIVAPNGSLSYFQNLVNATNTVVEVANSTAVVATSTWTTIPWTSANVANTSMWNLSPSPSLIFLPSNGIYVMRAEQRFITSAVGMRYTRIQYTTDGGTNFTDISYSSSSQAVTTANNRLQSVHVFRNTFGSTGVALRMLVFHTSGANNTFEGILRVQKLGDLYNY